MNISSEDNLSKSLNIIDQDSELDHISEFISEVDSYNMEQNVTSQCSFAEASVKFSDCIVTPPAETGSFDIPIQMNSSQESHSCPEEDIVHPTLHSFTTNSESDVIEETSCSKNFSLTNHEMEIEIYRFSF